MKNINQLLSLVLIFCFIQCSPVRIALEGDEWKNTEELAVKGRNGILIKQKLSFGNYHTSVVKRSWTRGNSSTSGIGTGIPGTPEYSNIISVEYINKKQTLRFNLQDEAGRQADVYCVSRFHSKDLYLGDNRNSLFNIGIDLMKLNGDNSSSLYYVQLYLNGETSPWQIVLDNEASQAKAKRYIGYLAKGANEYYEIIPVTRLLDKKGVARNMPFGSMGFEFRSKNGRSLAAVSLADNGKVYFSDLASGDERFLLANACAALLLQEVIG